MNYFLDAIKNKFADFNGRARRKEFWMFVLFAYVSIIALFIIAAILGSISSTLGTILMVVAGLASLAVIIPYIAVSVRRMHDIGKEGTWVLINFVPCIGGIWFLILCITEGVRGENQYGPDPKAGEYPA